jgi:hypothetical protein
VSIPNAVMIVVDRANILYEQTFIHPSFLSQQDIDIKRFVFTLGSISKTFTAIAVMQLIELNLVNLDTDIFLSHTAFIDTPDSMNSADLFPNHNTFLQMTL